MAQPSLLRNNMFAIFILVGLALFLFAGIIADWLWFDSLGYLPVFKTLLFSKLGLGAIVFTLFFVVLSVNMLIASKTVKNQNKGMYFSVISGLSFVAAVFASSFWFVLLRFLNLVRFERQDAVFQQDLAFYIFVLPFYEFALTVGFLLTVATIIVTTTVYVLASKKKKTVRVEPDQQGIPFSTPQNIQQVKLEFPKQGRAHLAYLSGILLLVVALYLYVKRFSILFSHRGVVFGAGFTDVHIMLPLYTITAIIAAVAGLIAFTYAYVQNTKLVFGGVALLLIVFFTGTLLAGLVQMLYVEPNEFNLEEEFIKRSIDETLYAFNLDKVSTRDFPVTYDLTIEDLNNNQGTVRNIRLWDWRPLLTTYKQIQLFRTYYDFVDVDVDRYMVDGQLRQLMIAPRELDQRQLDDKAKTWVNEKLVYTHGYGVVVSPVNRVSKEGLPELFVQDIPPKTSKEVLQVDQPRIYFGEKTNSFVLANTKTPEFDYPLGNENQFTNYAGEGGITLSNPLKKAVFALKLGSLNLFISSAVTSDSKVLLNRNIVQRASTLAPFLQYDSDPYVVIDQGRLFWVIDAYTTSHRFPYSEQQFGINYIRNSVKVVVDAFHGSVNFYIIDEKDPLIQNYAKIFPELFKPFSEMPEGLKSHLRYPEDLMRVQTSVYGTYHMSDPQVFYNKEDVWRTPNEVYSGSEVDLRPYYIILKLPEEEKEGFFLITPLIPRGKENMIAWFAAHSDPENYGQIEIFKLSKQELTYGPMQIEARIDQDTEISQLLTLWGQQGSEVIRGNLLVIPIEDSFLYIEPIYLKASAGGALPQLKRVIVAYEDQLTMQESLEGALNVIFKGKLDQLQKEINELGEEVVPSTLNELFQAASQAYKEAQDALVQGDFSLYAEKIEEVGRLLTQE